MKKIRFYRRKFGSTVLFVIKIIAICAFICGLVYVFFKLDYFDISDVEIKGVKNFVSSTDLNELAESRSLGKNIFLFKKRKLEESLKKDFQGAKTILIRRKLPSTLVVNVEERVALAVVKDLQDDYFLVDNEGYVLGKIDPSKTNLPKVNYGADISVGFILEPGLVLRFLSLLKVLDENKILVSDLTITSEHISFYIDSNDVQVLISNKKSEKESVEVLGSLLEKLSTEGKDPSLIDLRYDKVVVSYK